MAVIFKLVFKRLLTLGISIVFYCREKLPNVNLERLLEAEPRLLLADIDEVLSELQRFFPGVENPEKLVFTHAGMVLPMKYAGMESSLFIDDGIQAD